MIYTLNTLTVKYNYDVNFLSFVNRCLLLDDTLLPVFADCFRYNIFKYLWPLLLTWINLNPSMDK